MDEGNSRTPPFSPNLPFSSDGGRPERADPRFTLTIKLNPGLASQTGSPDSDFLGCVYGITFTTRQRSSRSAARTQKSFFIDINERRPQPSVCFSECSHVGGTCVCRAGAKLPWLLRRDNRTQPQPALVDVKGIQPAEDGK